MPWKVRNAGSHRSPFARPHAGQQREAMVSDRRSLSQSSCSGSTSPLPADSPAQFALFFRDG